MHSDLNNTGVLKLLPKSIPLRQSQIYTNTQQSQNINDEHNYIDIFKNHLFCWLRKPLCTDISVENSTYIHFCAITINRGTHFIFIVLYFDFYCTYNKKLNLGFKIRAYVYIYVGISSKRLYSILYINNIGCLGIETSINVYKRQ